MAFTDEEIAEFDSVVAAALQRTEEPSEAEEPAPQPTETASEPEVDEAAFWSQLSEQYNLEPVGSAIPRTLSQEASVGFERGKDQTQGLLYGFTGLLGQALGLESIEKYGIENYMRKMEEAAQNQATIQDPTEEIEGLGDILTYATGVLSEQIPQLLISVGGGGIGGLVGKTVAKRIITNEIAKRTLAGMAQKEAAEEVAKLVAQNALTAASSAPTRGAIGGAYLANFGQISGGSFGQIAQETGEGDALAAAGFAFPGAALDTAGEIFVAGKFLKPFTKAGRAAMEGVDTAAGISLPARVGRNVAIGAPTGAVVEGGVEYGQTATEQMALGAADPNRTIGEVLSTPEAERERRIAAIAGATVGGPLSGAGSVVEALAPQTAAKLRELPARQPQQAGQEQEQQESISGTWMEPVTIPTQDETLAQIEYRRNQAGQVAAFNVPENYRPELPRVQTELGPAVLISRTYKNGSAIRSLVNAAYSEKENPDAFKAPTMARPQPKQEDLVDADLPEGQAEPTEEDLLAQAAERRRLRDAEILQRNRTFAEATVNRPPEDSQAFVSSLAEGDQVSVISQDEDGNQFSIPMNFIRINSRGQAEFRTDFFRDQPNEPDAVYAYDPEDFNLITTRNVAEEQQQDAPAPTPRLTAPITPAEGQELTAEERAQNLIYFSDQGRRIDENLWRNSARELGIELTEEMQSPAAVEMAVRKRFGQDRPFSKQGDPASEILIDALGPNPTRQRLEAITKGTPWTGPGSEFTWGVKDGLGGEIPVTTRLWNRKSPAEPLNIPTRQVAKGFKPEDQTTRPAAPEIEAKGPDLVATSRAQFVGVRDDKNGLVTQRPVTGRENATYLERVDTAADTTIRQMNFLGQPVEVTPETAQSLNEANQFWVEHQERQRTGRAVPRNPVRFFTQERADKDGNRKTYITGVTYEGRTYRTGKTPDDFTVDRPLTERGSNSRRRGRGIYDAIRPTIERRRIRSEAAIAGAETEQPLGPLSASLEGMRGRASLAGLNAAEDAVYAFYNQRLVEPLMNANVPVDTLDRALENVRTALANRFNKAKQNQGRRQEPNVPRPRQARLGAMAVEKLSGYLDAKRFLAVQKLQEAFEARQQKRTAAKAGARGTGTARALKLTPQGAVDLLTKGRRNQKTNITEAKRMSREEAMQSIQDLVDFEGLSQSERDKKVIRVLNAAERFTPTDRDFMVEQIISELAETDRQRGLDTQPRTEKTVFAERKLLKDLYDLIGDPEINSMNLGNVRQSALAQAKKVTENLREVRQTQSMDDETSGAAEEAGLAAERPDPQVTQGELAEKGRPLGVEDADPGDIAPFIVNLNEAAERYASLSASDIDLLDRLGLEEIERGGLRQRQIRGITENERLRAARVVAFLKGQITNDQLNADRNRRLSGEEEYIRRAAQRRANAGATRSGATQAAGVSGGAEAQTELAGVAESRARRSPEPAPDGRPERVVGATEDAAGTVQGQDAGTTGGRGVQPTPFRTRTVAAAAQRDFAGAILGLGEAETATLPQGIVDRVYQAYLSTFDAKAAEQSNNPLSATAAPMADAVSLDGKKLFERYADERLSPDQLRAMDIRKNMAQAYRAGLFDDNPVVSAINKLANDETQPRQLRLIAKEFVKNARRGVEFGNVVLDIGRFTNPDGGRSTWAALFGISPDGESVVSVNLDNLHDQDSLPLSFLHELQHVVIRDKVRRRVPLTRTEEAALNRLENFRRQAVIAAARDQGFEVAGNPDIEVLANQLYNLTDPNRQESGAAVDNRRLAGLVNLEEFVIEMIGNPDFVNLLAELGFGAAETQGRKFTLTGAIRDAWNAVVELITGTKVDPTSPLAMAFKDSWTINFGTQRNPNITEIKAGRRLAEREQRQMATDFIDREIEARNRAGTTADRAAIAREITGPADRSTQQAAERVRQAATTLSLEEFVQWAPDNGFNFVDPIAVYQSLREPAVQGSGITDQVAESRAVGTPQRPLRAGASEQLDKIAWQQRGAPEKAMTEVQMYFQGPTDNVVEHAGDLMHRVYKDNENDTAGFGMAENKVDRVLRTLNRPTSRGMMSFEQEVDYVMRDNARYSNVPEEEYRQEVDRRLKVYADAHAALPAENDAQRTIRQIAVDIGNKRWSDANAGLQKLKSRMTSPEAWREYAFEGFLEDAPQVAESRARSRVTPQQDQDYLAAVERGDMETAQRMVDEAARAAGYNIGPVWHWSPNGFNIFDISKGDEGFHFGSQKAAIDRQNSKESLEGGGKFYRVFLRGDEVIEVPDLSSNRADNLAVNLVESNRLTIGKITRMGNDVSGWSVIQRAAEKRDLESRYLADNLRKEYMENISKVETSLGRELRHPMVELQEAIGDQWTAFSYKNEMEDIGSTSYAVMRSEQIKLSDPVTRDAQGNVIPLSQRFNEENPDIRFSRARARRMVSETDTTVTGKTYTRPGLIAGENANLDPRANELISIKKRFEKAAENFSKIKANELTRLIRRTYRNEPVPMNLINDALGNLDNPFTEEQFEELRRLEATDPDAAVKKRIAYLSANRERFRVERQAPALEQLPEDLADLLRELGNDLTELQEQALKLGIPKGDMKIAFTENLGIYLTRSYNAFLDQEGWERNLRAEDAELGEMSRMGQMRNEIRSILIGTRADEAVAAAQAEGRTLSREKAEADAKAGTTTEEVDQMLETYIAYTKSEPSSESFSGLRLPGRKNIKSLTARKSLSDALRNFYGQVENPAVNFVTSYAKLSSLIANHQFQSNLKNLGLKEGWLWDPDAKDNIGQRPPPGFERIAADNDRSLDVLSGLFARSDLVRGLRESFPPNSLEAAQWWLHPFMKFTGLSMGLKTVGSVASQVRNYWGSYAVPIAGGNLTIADLFNKDWRKNWKYAHEVSLANVFSNYGNNRKALVDDIKALYELGVMGESLTVGLLNDLTQLGRDAAIDHDKFVKGFEKYMTRPGKKVWDATKGVWKKAEQIYGMTDDIFKVFTYLSELDKYRKVYPNRSVEQLRQEAATRARDIHWTYSKAPAIVNELKKFPFIAPFVTFTTETIRITLNIGRLAISERKQGQALIEQGRRNGDAELVRQGNELLKISNKRARGMAAVAVGPWALGAMAMTAAGLSGDDLEDLRQFLPDWQKNSQIMILGRNGSEINYVDVSYLDPFEVWKKPMMAFYRGVANADNAEELFTKAVVGAAIEAARPFTSEQILAGAVMDVMRNRDANGRQVYNPQDSGDAIAFAVGKQLAAAFTPGTLDTGTRIFKAATDQMSETGRAYGFANEVLGVPLGSRISAVDAEQALGFKANQFLRARRDARSIFNRDYLTQGSRSEGDVISAYERSNASLQNVVARMRREYLAALNLGMSPAKARNLMRSSGLDRDTVRMVTTGMYRRLTPTEEQNKIAPADRQRIIRQIVSQTPARTALP